MDGIHTGQYCQRLQELAMCSFAVDVPRHVEVSANARGTNSAAPSCVCAKEAARNKEPTDTEWNM